MLSAPGRAQPSHVRPDARPRARQRPAARSRHPETPARRPPASPVRDGRLLAGTSRTTPHAFPFFIFRKVSDHLVICARTDGIRSRYAGSLSWPRAQANVCSVPDNPDLIARFATHFALDGDPPVSFRPTSCVLTFEAQTSEMLLRSHPGADGSSRPGLAVVGATRRLIAARAAAAAGVTAVRPAQRRVGGSAIGRRLGHSRTDRRSGLRPRPAPGSRRC
jgi:hypothetical protein